MRVSVATLAAALVATAGLTALPGAAGAAATGQGAAAVADSHNAGFFEQYRGRHIMGWGRDESACAYIDGVQLELLPLGDDRYLSVVQAFQQEHGVRGITTASVRALGDARLTPPDPPVPHCPVFIRDRPAGT
jgi:hypothetical protein